MLLDGQQQQTYGEAYASAIHKTSFMRDPA